MSQKNVEMFRRGFELWLSGDFAAWRETIHPNIGWDAAGTTTRLSSRKVVDAGEQVLAVFHEAARMSATDVLLDRHLIQLWTIRDGRSTSGGTPGTP